MSKHRISKKRALWKFEIHADLEKGPNRTEYTPSRAIKFFKNRIVKYTREDTFVKVTHRPSGLYCTFSRLTDLEYFVDNLVAHVGASK